jgi:hypothetical protein
LQTKKAIVSLNGLVGILKPLRPHKELKTGF